MCRLGQGEAREWSAVARRSHIAEEAKYRFNSGMRKEAGGSGRPISANPPHFHGTRPETQNTQTDTSGEGRAGAREKEAHASTQRPMDCAMRASVHWQSVAVLRTSLFVLALRAYRPLMG